MHLFVIVALDDGFYRQTQKHNHFSKNCHVEHNQECSTVHETKRIPFLTYALPKTNIAPENSPSCLPIIHSTVSFRKGNYTAFLSVKQSTSTWQLPAPGNNVKISHTYYGTCYETTKISAKECVYIYISHIFIYIYIPRHSL